MDSIPGSLMSRNSIGLGNAAKVIINLDQSENKDSNNSYRQILKSSTIIGGASVINIFLRIIRVKCLAVLLGPAGLGLIGIYSSITGMIGTIAGMGIGSSGVRQIAEAASTGNEEKIARTSFVLRRVSLLLGVFGMILLILLSSPICRLTFGNTEYASDVALLSFTLFFMAVSSGQSALIQGMRKIGDLAKLNVLGALLGTIFSIPIIYIWGQKGIVPFLIALSALGILTSWWYARKIKVASVWMGWREMWSEARALLNLGLVLMASGLMATGAMYLLRVLVVRGLGMDAAGLYQAAETLSSIYVGFILEAMGKDFYPRLTSVAQNNTACNQLVNEQAEIGFLLAVPGILATLTFAPLIIHIFYSAKFTAAFEILRWQILGILLRVASWPMGFMLLAKGKGTLFFWTELLANSVHVGLIWAGIVYFGLIGTGIAFFILYLFYWVFIFVTVKQLSGFTWSAANVRIGLLILPTVGTVFLARYFLSDIWSMILGSIITIAVGIYSYKFLSRIVGSSDISTILIKIKGVFAG